jgi:hypothetical protein
MICKFEDVLLVNEIIVSYCFNHLNVLLAFYTAWLFIHVLVARFVVYVFGTDDFQLCVLI